MTLDELEQDENRGQDMPDKFCEKVKEILENNVIELPTYQQSFEVWEQEDGQANP